MTSSELETDSLVDFLLRRIAEDEQGAQAAADWGHASARDETQRRYDRGPRGQVVSAGHVGGFGPRRVLTECDLKRRIVHAEAAARTPVADVLELERASFKDEVKVKLEFGRTEVMTAAEFEEKYTEPAGPTLTLRLLALAYTDHPDYRQEWAP